MKATVWFLSCGWLVGAVNHTAFQDTERMAFKRSLFAGTSNGCYMKRDIDVYYLVVPIVKNLFNAFYRVFVNNPANQRK